MDLLDRFYISVSLGLEKNITINYVFAHKNRSGKDNGKIIKYLLKFSSMSHNVVIVLPKDGYLPNVDYRRISPVVNLVGKTVKFRQ